MSHARPRAVLLPPGSQISTLYPRPDLADAFAIDLPPDTASDPEVLARFIFSHQPRWVGGAMAVRDTVVTAFGLKTGRGLRSADPRRQRIGIFKLYEKTPTEVIAGEDDKHLDFRVSVLYRAPSEGSAAGASVVVSTVVRCHNLLGRTYLAVVTPFHKLVVRSYLRHAAAVGWPTR